ncbi:MAG: electron transport complex subunit RsxC [Candidatus Firestonebacteria bacterium]|nr:electron transport complex subunit RsxC [Candidatus Firestonebacteria bacterium]
MDIKTFNRGIHPEYKKELTKNKSIEKCSLPSQVVIPLQQHTGIICKSLVKPGDIVYTGQKIGEAEGFITAPVHASISGKVIEILPKFSPTGKEIISCIIESDGNDTLIDTIKPRTGYYKLNPSEIISIIKDAGIVGQGGAAFPTHVKLLPPKSKIIDTLIINGAECEPYLTCDHRLMLEFTKEIITGIEILMYATGIKKVFVGVEINKQDAIECLKIAGKNTLGLEIVPLKIKYPQGSEKHLIKAITGKEVPSGGLPMDVGVVVNNVGTVNAVYNAVMNGKPVIDRVVTVTGEGISEPKNLLVRIGTSVEHIINFCGGLKSDIGKIIIGGPMMGFAQFSLQIPVLKGTSGIVIFPKNDVGITNVSECIRCGRCVEVCPMGLSPYTLVDISEFNYYDDIMKFSPMDCIECGCCSYICPSNRYMVHYIRQAKLEVLAKQKK